jgi:hypothetical protein
MHHGRVNMHLVRVNIHLGRVNIHLGRVNTHPCIERAEGSGVQPLSSPAWRALLALVGLDFMHCCDSSAAATSSEKKETRPPPKKTAFKRPPDATS